MVDPRSIDLRALDRDVATAVARLARWRSTALDDPESAALDDPFGPVRSVSSRSMRDVLRAASPSAPEAPLRDGLARWVTALVFARIGLPDDLAWARRALAPEGVYEGSADGAAEGAHADGGERSKLVSWREAWRGAVAARSAAATGAWLEAAAAAGPGLAAVARTAAARRLEVAKRLDLVHPWEAVAPVEPSALRAAASRLLAATDAVATATRIARTPSGGLAAVLHDAVARDAGAGWPARLSPRWLYDAFGKHLGRSMPDPGTLPRALGGASFARALVQFGFALRVAWAPASMPFALAREPGSVAAHRLGYVFGGLAADVSFQSRTLGLTRRAAAAQARRLAEVALVEARLQAARTLLGDDAEFAPRDRFEELTARVFGAPADARFAGAWPCARHDDAARLAALVEAEAAARSLRDRFDDDWFRNPRAWESIREQAETPAHEPLDGERLNARADALGRRFEESLA